MGRAHALPHRLMGVYTMRIAHYGNTRYWTVYDGATLVCVCVYKRGAVEVLRRLSNR